MTATPTQTGHPGRPVPPLVVSCALSGSAEIVPAEVVLARSLRTVTEDLRAALLAEGEKLIEGRRLSRTTPDWRVRTFTYPEGGVDDAVWEASLAGLGTDYDGVSLGSEMLWWDIDTGAPSLKLVGSWSVTAAVTVPTEDHARQAAKAMQDALLAVVEHPGVGSAFVHVDGFADPYTEIVSPVHRDHPTTFDDVVHGYYWSVVLGPGHIERLGGLDQVTAEAPCEVVRPVIVAGSPGLVCQVTADPAGLAEEALRAWRTYLGPVLRFGYPERNGVIDHLERLGRSLWLFEGEPATRGATVSLQSKVRPPEIRIDWPADEPDEEPDVDDEPTIWIHCVEGCDPTDVLSPVRGVVQAWRACGFTGRLVEVTGTLRRCTDVTIDTSDDGARALAVQVDFGDLDVGPAVDRLAAALETVTADDRRTRLIDHISIG